MSDTSGIKKAVFGPKQGITFGNTNHQGEVSSLATTLRKDLSTNHQDLVSIQKISGYDFTPHCEGDEAFDLKDQIRPFILPLNKD